MGVYFFLSAESLISKVLFKRMKHHTNLRITYFSALKLLRPTKSKEASYAGRNRFEKSDDLYTYVGTLKRFSLQYTVWSGIKSGL
ncbi:hypothetical protein VN97_g10699 [Penicillium thymicola]|uniref:Uncharacterized protein n=1 Tax=Penicillium thymicola TaxID=293382 RepID=A0AAI9T8H9_PENTH|nr:hypothetical protein VN97_g10699 [Penicillium thymicola]